MKFLKLENTADVGILIIVLMVLGLAVAWATLGQWDAVRGFGVEMVILAVTFYIARQYLPWEDAERARIRRPGPELWLGLLAFVGLFVIWPFFFDNDLMFAGLLFFFRILGALLALGALAAVVLATLRYGRDGWGLRWPTRRELIVLVVVAAVAVGLSQLFGRLLPLGEVSGEIPRPLLPGMLLWVLGNTGALEVQPSVLPFLYPAVLLVIIGQELYFRVFMQTRLAHVLPGRWALFAQAALYFVACTFPWIILALRGGDSPLAGELILTQAAVLSNGVLAGYFWRKTGSLPLLVLLHLLAFVRWGL